MCAGGADTEHVSWLRIQYADMNVWHCSRLWRTPSGGALCLITGMRARTSQGAAAHRAGPPGMDPPLEADLAKHASSMAEGDHLSRFRRRSVDSFSMGSSWMRLMNQPFSVSSTRHLPVRPRYLTNSVSVWNVVEFMCT